jgi:hypothetical protein
MNRSSWLFDLSGSSVAEPQDEQDGRMASVVRRGDRLREASDQSFRHRKDLGLPNQVCLFRREQNTIWMRPKPRIGTALAAPT